MTAFEHIITVDGATGSGKTTLLRALAMRLGIPAVELGPIVRTVAWLAEREQIPVVDAVALVAGLEASGRLRIDRPAAGHLAASEVEVDGRPLRQQVFSGRLNQAIAAASLDSIVMSWIHSLFRESLRSRRAVVSGREGASRIFPTAGARIRLEADSSVREARKRHQLTQAGMRPIWLDDVQLLDPPGSEHVVLDTTLLSIEQVSELALRIIGGQFGWTPATRYQERIPEHAGLHDQLRSATIGLTARSPSARRDLYASLAPDRT